VFAWKSKRNLDPIYRVVYTLQFAAVLVSLAGLFLAWWTGDRAWNAFNLMDHSRDKFAHREPDAIVDPLMVVWFIWPSLVVSGLRGFTGMLVAPVTYHRLALVACLLAVLVLGHFYVSFGDDLDDNSPLAEGSIQAGFWVTGLSSLVLGLLLLTEFAIKPPKEDLFVSSRTDNGPVNDAERLWRGDFLTCPYCGMLNEPKSRRCFNCHNLLFDFEDLD
jgi:hypothetical protein